MSTITKLQQGYTITTADNANFLLIGDVGHGNQAGNLELQFVPSVSAPFTGSLAVMGRIGGGPLMKQEAALGVPFASIPYRRVILNGVCYDYSMTAVGAPDLLTGASILHIPSYGLSIALLVTCTQGTGTVYYRTLEGAGSP